MQSIENPYLYLKGSTRVDFLDNVYEQREITLERLNTIQNINYKHEIDENKRGANGIEVEM